MIGKVGVLGGDVGAWLVFFCREKCELLYLYGSQSQHLRAMLSAPRKLIMGYDILNMGNLYWRLLMQRAKPVQLVIRVSHCNLNTVTFISLLIPW